MLKWRIIYERKRQGLSQRQLAIKAGVSNATVSRFEAGKTTQPHKIKALENALNLGKESADNQILADENAELRLKIQEIKNIVGSQ